MEGLRQIYKRRFMYQVVMSYIRSNQSQEEFSRANKISASKLKYWYRRYKQEIQTEDLLVSVEVDDVPVIKEMEAVKITFPNGMVVEVLSSTPANLIQSLLSQN